MSIVVKEAMTRLLSQDKNSGFTTGDIRSISSELFREINSSDIHNVFELCEQLLKERKWQLSVIAYDWAYRLKKKYTDDTFFVFEKWLKEYITGWGDCDDFCTHAIGALLSQNNDFFEYVLKWAQDSKFIVRRASAVSLIYPIKKQKYQKINPFLISDKLMNDEHYLVLKGYGWMLKVLSQVEPDSVYRYLEKNKKVIPRLSYRYAIEKFDQKIRANLMKE